MVFCSVYIYTIELVPTRGRHSLMGLCSMFGRIGNALAPLTPMLVGRLVRVARIVLL
ncbi:solute carrier family 22 member 15-like [Ostrinia furnacalis]|uniref:solute carrier family 22 member 15-like n=1 Tax=Ostrinia furnacalis TaxID=93504 RepID=UPI001039939D|nr:solute carrier family 22 member 15-like [Ostrinia furnacalis]